VLGWRVPTAGDILGEVGLSLDKVTLDRTAPSEQQAERIYWQDPPAGSPIRRDRKLVDVRAYAQWNSPTAPTTPQVAGTALVVFLPGDSAQIDPRFVELEKLYDNPSHGTFLKELPRCKGFSIHSRFGAVKDVTTRNYSIIMFPTHEGASDLIAKFTESFKWNDKRAAELKADPKHFWRVRFESRYTADEAYYCTGEAAYDRPDEEAQVCLNRAVIYRDVFVICVGGCNRGLQYDFPGDAERMIGRAKALVDLRTPNK